MKGEINNNTIIVGDFNTPLTPMDRSIKQKMNKETQTLNDTVDPSHSSTFAWKIPWTEEPGRLQTTGSLESDTTERLHFHFHALEKEMKPGGLPSMGSHRVGHY